MDKKDLIINEIKKVKIPYDWIKILNGKTFLITGGNGLIGSYLLNTLALLSQEYNLNINLIGAVRDMNKTDMCLYKSKVNWITWELKDPFTLTASADYIIHTASSTSSNFFVTHPVELINDSINGFNEIIKYANKVNTKSIVYTSSLEVYGICNNDTELKEIEYYPIDPQNIRNSYPLLKKISEYLSTAYSNEYNINIKNVRLGQVFSPGVHYDDERVFAQFARSVITGKDIILKTRGQAKRSFCSIPDAIMGILTVLLYGQKGESYNLCSDNSYISIYDLAKLFIKDNGAKIIIKIDDHNPYPNTVKFALNTEKIKLLGFKSVENINQMVENLIKWFDCIKF